MKIRFLCVEHNADLVRISDDPVLVMDENDLSWEFDFSSLSCPMDYDRDTKEDNIDLTSCRSHVGAWRVVLE